MRFCIFLVAFGIARGQTARDPNAVLEQARARLQAMARNLEKYVCIETVDRAYYRRELPPLSEAAPTCSPTPAAQTPPELESTDRVRLEVTLSQGRELHSWPGATRFDFRDVDELIRNGPVSTGAFGGDLASVFGQPGVTFQYKGERAVNGKTLFEYAYRVPLEASHFEIKTASAWHPTAYEGEFLLDPDSLELERLTVRVNELPPGAAFCSAATTLEYQRVHIGDSDVVLPRRSELDIALNGGREAHNVTTFANCREYQAESAINFDVPSAAESTAARNTGRRVLIPLGLPVMLALIDPIDSATAASGDEVAAKVVKPVRRPGTSVDLIPAGAIVRGRIRRVEHHLFPQPYFLISIALNRVDIEGTLSAFAARSEPDPVLAKQLNAIRTLRDTGVFFWGVGTFLFPTNKSHTVIPAGYESKWFTLATGR